MIFTIDSYPFSTRFNRISLKGKVAHESIRSIHGVVDCGFKSILVRGVSVEAIVKRGYDNIFTDYCTAFKWGSHGISRIRSSGARLFIILPLLTAHSDGPDPSKLFSRVTGLPNKAFIREKRSETEYNVDFWESEWKDYIFDCISDISELDPDGILIRDVDLSYGRGRPESDMTELFSSVVSEIRRMIKTVYFETRFSHTIIDLYLKYLCDGIVFDSFFFYKNARTPTEDRMQVQSELDRLLRNDKEIYIMDVCPNISSMDEFVIRSRQRGFRPILKTDNEFGILDERLIDVPRIIPAFIRSYNWSMELSNLVIGDNRIIFKSSNRILDYTLVRRSPVSWPELLLLPSRYLYFSDEVCSMSFNDTMLYSMDKKSENDLILRLRYSGFESIFDQKRPSLVVLLSDFNRGSIYQLLASRELKLKVELFTKPVRLSPIDNGIRVTNWDGDSFYDVLSHSGTSHNMIIISIKLNESVFVVMIGDNVAVKAMGFVLDNLDRYIGILNDESVTMLTAVAESEDNYRPSYENIIVKPMVDKIPLM